MKLINCLNKKFSNPEISYRFEDKIMQRDREMSSKLFPNAWAFAINWRRRIVVFFLRTNKSSPYLVLLHY